MQWSPAAYIDGDGQLKPRRGRGMEAPMLTLLDVLRHTAVVLPQHNSTRDAISANLSQQPLYTTPKYLSSQKHLECLSSGDIPQLTLRALISMHLNNNK